MGTGLEIDELAFNYLSSSDKPVFFFFFFKLLFWLPLKELFILPESNGASWEKSERERSLYIWT